MQHGVLERYIEGIFLTLSTEDLKLIKLLDIFSIYIIVLISTLAKQDLKLMGGSVVFVKVSDLILQLNAKLK